MPRAPPACAPHRCRCRRCARCRSARRPLCCAAPPPCCRSAHLLLQANQAAPAARPLPRPQRSAACEAGSPLPPPPRPCAVRPCCGCATAAAAHGCCAAAGGPGCGSGYATAAGAHGCYAAAACHGCESGCAGGELVSGPAPASPPPPPPSPSCPSPCTSRGTATCSGMQEGIAGDSVLGARLMQARLSQLTPAPAQPHTPGLPALALLLSCPSARLVKGSPLGRLPLQPLPLLLLPPLVGLTQARLQEGAARVQP